MFTILDEDTVWTEDNDRKSTHVNGLDISVPKEYTLPKPVFCPICKLAMRNASDIISWEEFSCCSWCDNNFVRPNRTMWQSGWRPSWSDVDKLRAEKGRLQASHDFTSFDV